MRNISDADKYYCLSAGLLKSALKIKVTIIKHLSLLYKTLGYLQQINHYIRLYNLSFLRSVPRFKPKICAHLV